MLGRRRFWREDVRWYGANGEPDLSHESRSLAWRLFGAEFDEGDLYVMINAGEQPLRFHVQEGEASDWLRIVDTALPSPQDIALPGEEQSLASLDYEVKARSVAVLARARQQAGPTGKSAKKTLRPASKSGKDNSACDSNSRA